MLQLEQQYLEANLAQARVLLADAEQDDDPIGQQQMAQMVNRLERELLSMPLAIASAPAAVALFFGGRPVVGSQGIQAEFSGKAIERFQTIVSQRFAAEEVGPLAAKGRVPLKDATHLLVTDVVRGSFGFVLQGAPQPDIQALDTTLKEVVHKVADTISRVAAQDEDLFDDAVAEIDARQQGALTEFFRLLDIEGATMRIVEGQRDFELDRASVQRARQRVENMQITDRVEEMRGLIVGWTDHSARFELLQHAGGTLIHGGISAQGLEAVEREGLEPYHKHFRASVQVREVRVRNRPPKSSYTLTSLELISPPADWPEQPVQARIS